MVLGGVLRGQQPEDVLPVQPVAGSDGRDVCDLHDGSYTAQHTGNEAAQPSVRVQASVKRLGIWLEPWGVGAIAAAWLSSALPQHEPQHLWCIIS